LETVIVKLKKDVLPPVLQAHLSCKVLLDLWMARPASSRPPTQTYFRVPNFRDHQLSDPVQGGAGQLTYLLDGAPSDFLVGLPRGSAVSHPGPCSSQNLAFESFEDSCLDFMSDLFKERRLFMKLVYIVFLFSFLEFVQLVFPGVPVL
jgi:hypothetical protein